MALTTIFTGMEKGPEKIDANFKALDNSVATLTEGQKLTWIDLPLESGIAGGLSVAEAYNGSIIYIKGEINGKFDSDMLLSKSTGTPLIKSHWVSVVVVTFNGVQTIKTLGNGDLHYTGSVTTSRISVSGFFS